MRRSTARRDLVPLVPGVECYLPFAPGELCALALNRMLVMFAPVSTVCMASIIADLPAPFGPTKAVRPAISNCSTRNRYQSTRMTRRNSIIDRLGCFLLVTASFGDVFIQRRKCVFAYDDGKCGPQKQSEVTVVSLIDKP